MFRQIIAMSLAFTLSFCPCVGQNLQQSDRSSVQNQQRVGPSSKQMPKPIPLSTLVERGQTDPYVAYLVGRIFENGTGTPTNRPDLWQAFEWYKAADHLGSMNAKYRIGLLYSRGISDDWRWGKRLVPKGRELMQYAQSQGYSRETDAPLTLDPNADLKAALILLGVLAVAAVATAGNAASNAPSAGYIPPKYCMVPETVNAVDGYVLYQGFRAGYGYECP